MIAVLYFVLLQFLWSQQNITRTKDTFFTKKMQFFFLFQFLGHLPFTLIATTSVQYGVKKKKKERLEQ